MLPFNCVPVFKIFEGFTVKKLWMCFCEQKEEKLPENTHTQNMLYMTLKDGTI